MTVLYFTTLHSTFVLDTEDTTWWVPSAVLPPAKYPVTQADLIFLQHSTNEKLSDEFWEWLGADV